jgi:hypothetical protein
MVARHQMQKVDKDTAAKRAVEIRAGLQFFTRAIQMASIGYSPAPPQQARTAVKIALAGVIRLISDLFPQDPSFPAPLIQLRQDLDDLERGRVAPFFEPIKVSHRPPTALSEELFRAIAAAAMTRLMEVKGVGRDRAASNVARRLSGMGAKSSAKAITARQIAKWREKIMTELASENLGVAQYQHALEIMVGLEPSEAVTLMLESLTDISPANFPKKPPA